MHGTIGTDHGTDHGVMQIMDTTGHTSITWNPSDPAEVRTAREMFDEMVTEKGFSAFRIEGDNQQGKRITSFDATAARIMLVPAMRGG